MTKLPPPEQWVLWTMSEMEAAEMIEQHIEHYVVDKDGNRSGALADAIRPALHEPGRWRTADRGCLPRCRWCWRTASCWRRRASIGCAASSSSFRTNCARSSRSPRTARRRRSRRR